MDEKNISNMLESGKRIREIRNELKLTQDELSELLDVSQAFYGYVERGTRRLGVKNLIKFKECTGASIDYILCGNKENLGVSDNIDMILLSLTINEKEFLCSIVMMIKELALNKQNCIFLYSSLKNLINYIKALE